MSRISLNCPVGAEALKHVNEKQKRTSRRRKSLRATRMPTDQQTQPKFVLWLSFSFPRTQEKHRKRQWNEVHSGLRRRADVCWVE